MAFAYKKKTLKPKVKTTWVGSETFEGKKYFFHPQSDLNPEPAIRWDKPEELKTPEEKEKTSGEWVWAPHKTEYWTPAKVVKRKGDGSVEVKPFGEKSITIPANGVFEGFGRKQVCKLNPVNHLGLEYLEDDVIALDPVGEETILHNLRERYKRKEIYTWVGAGRSILLSLNPYEYIEDLYSDETKSFHKSSEDALKPDKWVPPHVYAIANQAYDAMLSRGSNQSVLVNGESGSGKTEATKQILDFLAGQVGSDNEDHHVSEKLIVSNPLIEAFGNAQTIRNNNSSRFGKWIKVSFDSSSSKISGAKFVNFMLEKTRVIHHGPHERNYHIFYQLIKDPEQSQGMGLEKASKYRYTNQNKNPHPKAIDDIKEFAIVKNALNEMEFTPEQQKSIFKIVAGILNLGNISYKDAAAGNNNTGSKIVDKSWQRVAADLLGVSADDMEKNLTHRVITAGKEKTYKPLDAEQAQDATDALAKHVYGKLFDYLVLQMNESMAPPDDGNFIGILDIFGFEVLEENSFEQLCINFCNEKLQHYLNNHVFKAEERFYKTEGIDFHFLEFIDNQETLDLFEATKPNLGMLRMLDDEGKIGAGSDDNWLSKVEKQWAGNNIIQFDKRRKFESNLSFEINHYAGHVKYDAKDFVMKNKDTLWNNLTDLMNSSSDEVVNTIFPKSNAQTSKIKPVAGQFREHLNDLLKLIDSTEARFIRCIKANQKMQPMGFDALAINEQLTYAGVYESVRIRQGGYPFRLRHKQFAYRFMCINHVPKQHKYTEFPDDSLYWSNICKEILNTHEYDFNPEDIIVGETMVMYRVNMYKPLRLLRNLSIEVWMPFRQAFVRGCIGRYYAHQMHEAHNTFEKALELGNDIVMVRKGFELVHDTKEWLEKHASWLPEYPMFLYNKGRYLEGRLMEWEKHQEYMEGITNGLTPDVVTVPQYKDILAAVNKADAPKEEGGLGDVVRTAAQVELYAFAQTLVLESQPGWVTKEAPLCFKTCTTKNLPFKDERARMTVCRDKAIEIGYEDGLPESDTVQKIKDELQRLTVIDTVMLQAMVRRGMASTYIRQVAEAEKTLKEALALGNDIVMLRKGFELATSTREWQAKMSHLPGYPPNNFDQGKILEGRLMEWEAHEAYISGLITGKTVDNLEVSLYNELRIALKKADNELGDVVRTAGQQSLYDETLTLCNDSEPGQVDAEALPALESLIREDMQAVKDKADRIGMSTEMTQKIDHVISRLEYLDEEAPASVDVIDGVRMLKAIEEAREYKYESEATKKIDEMFAMPEEDFVKLELEAAIRLGDKRREIHRKIRLKEIFYEKEGQNFVPHTSSGHMRPGNYFKKGVFCGGSKTVEGQNKWAKKLPNPLTVLPNEKFDVPKDEIPDDVKQAKKDLKKQFKNLQYAMGDKKTNPKKKEKFTQEYLNFGLKNPGLRTELYYMIIKQLTENPEEESVKAGYELLALMLSSFLPSEDFIDYLVMWIRTHPDHKDEVQMYTSALHQKQFEEEQMKAIPALNQLRQNVRQLKEEGSRFSIPLHAFTGPSNQSHKSVDVRKFNQLQVSRGNML